MKRVLGLDLGTTSIGWALVNEGDAKKMDSSIVKVGVRIIQYDTFTNAEGQEIKGNPADFFSAGKSVSPNASRTMARSMRRNLQRYKLRRDSLKDTLKECGIMKDNTLINESGPGSTYQTISLRAKAASEEIPLEELARVLVHINKKRGYKSNRKAQGEEDEMVNDGMDIARILYKENLTPGQYVYSRIREDRYNIPAFFRSDLQDEFDRVWERQRAEYPELLTDALKDELKSKNKSQTSSICLKAFGIEGRKQPRGKEQIRENYELRAKAVESKLDLEDLAIVLQEINGQIRNSSGLLGTISDRSKELIIGGLTIGQWLKKQIDANPLAPLKNKSFFRQDYIDEFDRIWEVQSQYHPELTPGLKKKLRDKTIFYQRPLRSQKGLVGLCEFEHRDIRVIVDGREKTKTVGLRACPKSSPLFQEFKIWQVLNNLKVNGEPLPLEDRERLFRELSVRGKLKDREVLSLLYGSAKGRSLNFKEVEGNNTISALYRAYSSILVNTGHEELDFSKVKADEAETMVSEVFSALGWKTGFLHFDSSLDGAAYQDQPMFRLWHLLYSFEGDKSPGGNESLIKAIMELTGMDGDNAKILSRVTFAPDYGNLSSKAMRRILPYMRQGMEYSEACAEAGYRHSARSLTREELDSKEYADSLDVLPKNSLRNPTVEKILNQMVNVVNEVIATYGKPDEIRIELARELKMNAEERKKYSDKSAESKADNERYRQELREKCHIDNPNRNDILRYRLYLELGANGYKTLYSDTYIPLEDLFTHKFNIEHIIPQAKRFDDSFSNKTLEASAVNLEKSDMTAYDYVRYKYGSDYAENEYASKIEKLYKDGRLSAAKRSNLLKTESEIEEGFINRDLRESQYIAKKAKEMLEDLVPDVVSTTGSVTSRLREDWMLVDVMKELNWEKYDKLGRTYSVTNRDGDRIDRIDGWTKRNDHRHHAMDAIAIAFTRRSYLQYLNNLNARDKSRDPEDEKHISGYLEVRDIDRSDRTAVVMAIERGLMERKNNRLRFIPPMPPEKFRSECKRQLENILVSFKSGVKVATLNVNTSKKRGGTVRRVQLTPRGQLHLETVYGHILQVADKEEKVGASFDRKKIGTVVSAAFREALLKRLDQFGGDPKKAFCGKNSPDKNPIFLDGSHSESVPSKVKVYEDVYTKRVEVGPDLKIDKVIDRKVQAILRMRLDENGGDPKKAFSNLDSDPIWLNREKGIAIKRVTITAKSNVVSLHDKRDNTGNYILDENGDRIASDFVSTGNNHHVALYRDADGVLQEKVVSLYEAVSRVRDGYPAVDRDYNKAEGWTFVCTLKRNDCFVFPNDETGFDPNDCDLTDPANYSRISPNLFRVQKVSTKYYVFRHHLETTTDEDMALKDITWKRITALNNMSSAVKVQINHTGRIVKVGE